jgi:NTE family protein
MQESSETVAMAFGGGLGLAAYHAGAYETFCKRSARLHWVAGSSAGAVTAALIAGNPDDRSIERLRAFWKFPPSENYRPQPWQHVLGWAGAVGTRLVGSHGHFYPCPPSIDPFVFRSLYDLAPMRERLQDLIDFGRLNSGETRISVVATEMDHLMASCGYLPEFAPLEFDGRLLGDGGLSFNVPFDPILNEQFEGDLLLYVIDLYARDGSRPISLEGALERKNDLLFGNQTVLRLKYSIELRKARAELEGVASPRRRDRIVLLSYRPGMEEPGPEKSFELSPAALAQRWKAGVLDMDYAMDLRSDDDFTAVRRK